MSDAQPNEIKMECNIPVEWASQLQAIALAMNVPMPQLMVDAIGLYLSRQTPVAPTMAAGMTYEELESEPDEILWDFLSPEEQAARSALSPVSHTYGVDLGDDLDEILPDFLEP